MPKKIKQEQAFKLRKIKHSKRDIIALILALIAVSFLILYSVYFLAEKVSIINLLEDPKFPELSVIWPAFIIVMSLIWVVFSIVMAFIIYKIEKKQYKWHSLFIISLISIVFVRVDTFILGIIASLLYYKEHH